MTDEMVLPDRTKFASAADYAYAALRREIVEGRFAPGRRMREVELAEQICKMVPCAELVRFANSGSEAISGAIRAARGFTGKNKILKFEGHYHGWVDVLAVIRAGVRRGAVETVQESLFRTENSAG